MKIYRVIYTILFFIIIILPLCFINVKPDQISEIDNSKLPEASEVKDIDSLETYLSRRIGLRENIINSYTKINDILFNRMVHPTYTYGKEGYVFFKIEGENRDNDYLDTFASLVKKMQDYTEKRGIYFLFIINPTKISVYREYLPAGYKYTDYRISYLKNKFDEIGVNYIDNTDCLDAESNNRQVFNKKYDAGHWNDIGAFYGINNIYKKLKDDGIEISSLDISDYNIQYQVEDTLPVSKFEIYEEVPKYYLNNKNYSITNKYQNHIDISDNHSYYIETNNEEVNNNYKLLFFRGSYMNNKEKFISNKFSQAYLIHNYDNSINFDYYYNITKPDIVLFETVEYAIAENYYSCNQIENREYNESYENFKNLEEGKILDLMIENDYDEKDNIVQTERKLSEKILEKDYLRLYKPIYDFNYNCLEPYIKLYIDLLDSDNNDTIERETSLEYGSNYIRTEINNNYDNKIPLTKINLPKGDFKYAYLRVDGQIYDFCYNQSECYITLDTELLYNKEIEIIVISQDLTLKQTIKID